MPESSRLTKTDTVALWHAVQWMALCVRSGELMPGDKLAIERARLVAAKRALRKVNAIRKANGADAPVPLVMQHGVK
jgi:hypothetical protein